MSSYERRIPQELIHTFIKEIRSSKYFLESSNSLISQFKGMGISSLKMSFIWLFETVREAKKILMLPQDFDYLAFKDLRNRIVHNPDDWDKGDVLKEVDSYVEELYLLITNLSR